MPVLAWCAVILGASSIPASGLDQIGIAINDKLVHAAEYCVLAGLFVRQYLRGRGARPWAGRGAAVAFAALLGAIDETYQRTVPGRTPSWADWSADLIGATVGALVVTGLIMAHHRREGRRLEGENR